MRQTDSMYICIIGVKIAVFLCSVTIINKTDLREGIGNEVRYLYSMNQSDHDTPGNNFFITPRWNYLTVKT